MKNEGSTKIVLPALRGVMGEWVYYSCLMTLDELAKRVSYAEEIHNNKNLCKRVALALDERGPACYEPRRRLISGSTSSTTVLSARTCPRDVSRRCSKSATVSFSRHTRATRTFFPTAAKVARRIGGISPIVI